MKGLHSFSGKSPPYTASGIKHLQILSFPGLVREQDVGLRDFLSHDGFSVLMRGMQSDSEKLRTKSAFLLLNLLSSHPEHKGSAESECGLFEHLESSLYECFMCIHS